jgi:Xaa-Pro aminopeptidase
MIMPSIALPTGPYDWHPDEMPKRLYEERVAAFRAILARHGVTHAIVHGNGFDYGALAWLTHFTPKLGPAYALVSAHGPFRLLFSGGPGMKPSASKLTWVEDVVALRSIERDARSWLEQTSGGTNTRLGLVEGAAMQRCDWRAVQRVRGQAVVELDSDFDALRARKGPEDIVRAGYASAVLSLASDTISRLARPGADLRQAAIEMERAAYAAGAQDVRIRAGRRVGGAPTTLPDHPLAIAGPIKIALAVRHSGEWAEARLVVGVHGGS